MPFILELVFLSFSPKSLDLNSYIRVVFRECGDFPPVTYLYFLTTGPKANQNPHKSTKCTLHDVVIYESIKSFSPPSGKNHVTSIHDKGW